MNREAHRLTYRVELPGGDGRLREMILYVSQKAEEMPRYGKTKLNKNPLGCGLFCLRC